MTTKCELAALVAEYREKVGLVGVETPSRERAALLGRDLPVVRRMVASAEALARRGRVRADVLDLARGLEERWTAELERGWTMRGVETPAVERDPGWMGWPNSRGGDDVAHVGYDSDGFSWQRRGRLEYS